VGDWLESCMLLWPRRQKGDSLDWGKRVGDRLDGGEMGSVAGLRVGGSGSALGLRLIGLAKDGGCDFRRLEPFFKW
jgi:hypothetical protein